MDGWDEQLVLSFHLQTVLVMDCMINSTSSHELEVVNYYPRKIKPVR